MKSFTWLKSLCPRLTSRARRPIRHARKLQLEVLEDRTVPATFLVTSILDDGSAGTLRDAIIQANATPGADTIAFDTANLFASAQTITLTGGELDVTDALTISGPGADRLAVSGNHASRVMEIGSGISVSLSGLTIENGFATESVQNGVDSSRGGGILNAGTLAVTNCTLSGNSALTVSTSSYQDPYGDGGGIYNVGTLTVTDSALSDNSVPGLGGGIYNLGSLTVAGTSFSGNSATDGGGISNAGSFTVTGSDFSGNSAHRSRLGSGRGGAITAGGATLATISNSTFSHNSADSGGGIFAFDNLAVTNCTLSGNSATGGSAGDGGGGICSMFFFNQVAVTNCTLSANSAVGAGGGIFNGGLLAVSDCTISNNTAGGDGGGIFSPGQNEFLTVTNCTVSGNSAGGDGGGIWSTLLLPITGCTISNNSANNGGGLYDSQQTLPLIVSGCTFSGNSASNNGGGIWAGVVGYLPFAMTVTSSNVSGNSAGNGGGIWLAGSLKMTNSTLADNSAADSGGGISFFGSNRVDRLTNVTIAANRCNTSASGGSGGGIWTDPSSQTFLTLNNTIVASNLNSPAPGATADDVAGALDSASAFNLIGTGGSGGLRDRSVDLLDNNQVGVADPGLGQLGDYGGPTQTVPLLAGSPAIGGGGKGLAVDPDLNRVLTSDQRGSGFARFYNGTVDIGAFESQLAPPRVTFTVTTANDSGPGSLRQYVQANNLLGGGNTIAFALPTPATITLSGGELVVVQDVTINGPGADRLALSGNHASRVFEFSGHSFRGSYKGGTSSLAGLTIENGTAGSLLSGGGIYMVGGALVISNSAFAGNSADFGGGIFNTGGILTVNSSTFSRNSANINGGGLYAGSIDLMTITGSTFASNSASGDGGGIAFFATGGFLRVSSSAFIGNSAGGNGGGIVFSGVQSSPRFTVVNSTFAANSAGSGGGIYVGGMFGGTQLNSDTITDNSAAIGGGLCTNENLTLSNTILAGNAATSDPDVSGSIFSISTGYNLVGIDPLLAPLGNYGGPTETMPLLPGSPALDVGSNALAVDALGHPLTTDQRGFQRVVNGTIDIGACENQVVVTAPSANPATLAGEAAAINLGSLTDANSTAGPWNVTVDWGDATTSSSFQTSTQGTLGTLTHAYGAAGSYTVKVTVVDANGDANQATFPVQVDPLTATSLQTLLTTTSTVTFQASADTTPAMAIQTVNALTNITQPVTIILDLGGQTWTTDTVANPPANVTLVIQNGTLVGGSPALIVAGGNVLLLNCTLTNTTDTPTILVLGGSLTLRNDTIQESTVGSQAAISITGGTVDLGTAASPGGNTIKVNGTGEFVHNTSANVVSAVGDTFKVNGTVLTSPSLSSTTLSTRAAGTILNQAVQFTATVRTDTATAGTPAGSVDFLDTTTNTDLGRVTLSGGTATLTTASLGVGSHVVVANYSGDATFLPSSDSRTQTVHYTFSGFLPPLNKQHSFGVGRTLPIKFQLRDVNGKQQTALSDVQSLQIQALDSNGNPVGAPFNPVSAKKTGLSYGNGDDTNGADGDHDDHFIFYWKTKGLAVGSYQIVLKLNDGTVQTLTLQLKKQGDDAGLVSGGGSGIGGTAGALLAGNVELYIDNSTGYFTPEELARIDAAVAAIDAVVGSYGAYITEVNDPTLANVVLDSGTTSAVGGYADGVLGCTTDAGEITLIQGWNFYAGSDTSQIGGSQYDFQTVVTHELGHALGLGHNSDATSVMNATLNAGAANHALVTADLNIPDTDIGACGLHAAVPTSDLLDHDIALHGDLLRALLGATPIVVGDYLTSVGKDSGSPDHAAGILDKPSQGFASLLVADRSAKPSLSGDGVVSHRRITAHLDQYFAALADGDMEDAFVPGLHLGN